MEEEDGFQTTNLTKEVYQAKSNADQVVYDLKKLVSDSNKFDKAQVGVLNQAFDLIRAVDDWPKKFDKLKTDLAEHHYLSGLQQAIEGDGNVASHIMTGIRARDELKVKAANWLLSEACFDYVSLHGDCKNKLVMVFEQVFKSIDKLDVIRRLTLDLKEKSQKTSYAILQRMFINKPFHDEFDEFEIAIHVKADKVNGIIKALMDA